MRSESADGGFGRGSNQNKLNSSLHDTNEENNSIAVIPAYNEVATIGTVVIEASNYVDQVIVIDDGSSDATPTVADKAGAKVLQQDQNQGKGRAVRRAIEFAREKNIQQCVLLDGDWQHDPSEIQKLLDSLESTDADLVVGSRYINSDIADTPLYRRFGQIVLDRMSGIAAETQVTDSQSGFRALNRKAIETVEIHTHGFGVETEMLNSAADAGLIVTEVPVTPNYDVPNPNNSNPILHGFSVVDTTLEIVRNRHPLLFFGVPGLTLMALGLAYGAYTMSIYDSGNGFHVAKALYSSVAFIIGTLSVFSALIMNMVGQKIDEKVNSY